MADAFTPIDAAHMARALQLARRGRYRAHPNPQVGCVIVRDGVVVGEGWHEQCGEAHAEINALGAAGAHARNATAFVTLEPCAHQGKTPPCAVALIEAGVSTVVAAMPDPYPEVSGQGFAALRDAGIEVRVGLLDGEARKLNEGYLSRVERGRPFVRLKIAASLDGAIAMASGESQWITGTHARDDVQRLRASSGAIITGVGTILDDDPSLTVREPDLSRRQPLRVILDTLLRTPPDARTLGLDGETLICCSADADAAALQDAGATILRLAADAGRLNISAMLSELADRQINDALVECGPTLAGSMLTGDFVDELVIYQAPHIMGNQTRPMFDTPNLEALADRRSLRVVDVRRLGDDTRIVLRP